MVSDYILVAALALLVVALICVRCAVVRRARRKRLERAHSLMSTIMRSTPMSARKAMRSDQARSGGKVVDTSEMVPDKWVRAPNSITGIRPDSD